MISMINRVLGCPVCRSWITGSPAYTVPPIHQGSGVVAFPDGHAKSYPFTSLILNPDDLFAHIHKPF